MFDNIQFDNISTTMNTQPYFQQGLIMIMRNTSSLNTSEESEDEARDSHWNEKSLVGLILIIRLIYEILIQC